MLKLAHRTVYTAAQIQAHAISHRFAKDLPSSLERQNMNLFHALNSAMDIALATDPT